MTLGDKIPFNDLVRSVIPIRGEIDAVISRVVSSGWFIFGPEHAALEEELASYVGVTHVVNVGNGTDALELGLAALGVSTGDLVITVANAGAYTTTATLLLGAEPVFCDIDPKTHLMSASTLGATLAAIDAKPAAIVVTHLYGALAPIEEILKVARTHGIPVLEDCAQSLGATVNGVKGGSLADIATTSFYPTKNLGALGDGGAVLTSNDDLAEKVRRMRQYGWASKYSIEFEHGRNSRMDELQAAILRVKLPLLDAGNQRRRDIHSRYEAAAQNALTFVNTSNESFIGHLAVVTSDRRDDIRAQLAAAGVTTDVHYPIPDHKQKFPSFTPRSTALDVTEWAATQVFSLPMFPELTDSEVDRVVAALESLS
jgi:aminotransferase EvaB